MIKNTNAMILVKNFSKLILANYARPLSTRVAFTEEHSLMSNMIVSYSLQENMKALQKSRMSLMECSNISIYKVPEKLRKVEPRAYDPHIVSIGPYHHGFPKLQASERLKLESLNRLVDSGGRTKGEISRLLDLVAKMEQEARGYYADDIQLSKEDFLKMMLLDGCFIVQLFRDLEQSNFVYSPLLSKRWMLPVVRRDLITLENQLPLIVLKTIFEETKSDSIEESSLEELALRFFDPLMPTEEHILKQRIECISDEKNHYNSKLHLLDLFHSSITLGNTVQRCKEPHMYRSVTELKESGIKVRVLRNARPLEMTFKRGVLKIPRLQIDDHTGSLFRNIVAYEQCHPQSKPDMTSYLFFLDKLINSAEDVALLHFGGVIQHSLGSNKQLAKLVNNLCVEVEYDGQESYLCEVVERLNWYSNHWLVRARARLKHGYFTNVWVSLSTIAAMLLIYLTVLQTACDVVAARQGKQDIGFWGYVYLALLHPCELIKFMNVSTGKSELIKVIYGSTSEPMLVQHAQAQKCDPDK